MRENILRSTMTALLLLVSIIVNAQTEISSIAELAGLDANTEVKLNLNDAHTVAYNYDYWESAGFLYLQDATGGTILMNFQLEEQKTLNGYILATTCKVGDDVCLKANANTNKDNITITDWKYEGLTTTIADILAGKKNYALVTIKNVTSSSTGSEYGVNLSDGTNEILLYDEWDRIKIAKVPEKCKSVTALVTVSVWTGEIYLIGISQDLIVDANTPDDGSVLANNISALSDVKDGDDVLVKLNNVHVSATYTNADGQKVAFMEDATGGTMFVGFDALEASTTLNGSVQAKAAKRGSTTILTFDADNTNSDDIKVTNWTPTASEVFVNGAHSDYWAYRLVKVTDVYCEADNGVWTLTQNDITITTDDLFGVLADLETPEYLALFVGVVTIDEEGAHHLSPISKELIVAGEAPEPEDLDGVAAIRYMTDGEEFTLQLDHAQVTWMEQIEYEGELLDQWTYIVEDKTGAVILEQFPFYDLCVGDYISGPLYGVADIKDYKSVSCVAADQAWSSDTYLVFEDGVLTATKLTVEEAKKPRWQNCFIELNNCEWTTGYMTFYGEKYEYPALYDGTATILYDDGWEYLPDGYALPSYVDNITGHVVSLWGCSFIFPAGPDSINSAIEKVYSNITANDKIYNLAGQRLSQPQKGVNIVNGKKYIIR